MTKEKKNKIRCLKCDEYFHSAEEYKNRYKCFMRCVRTKQGLKSRRNRRISKINVGERRTKFRNHGQKPLEEMRKNHSGVTGNGVVS